MNEKERLERVLQNLRRHERVAVLPLRDRLLMEGLLGLLEQLVRPLRPEQIRQAVGSTVGIVNEIAEFVLEERDEPPD